MHTRVAWILPAVILLACSGKTTGVGPDGGGASGDAATCVNVDLSTYDRSCHQASDCVSVTGGELCGNRCSCGGSFINADGLQRYQQATAAIGPASCFCPEEPAPDCIDGTCTTGADDAGTTSTADAATCVNIEASNYPRSCNVDSDCANVTPGVLCTGQCACGGGAPVNQAGLAEYEQAIQPLQLLACPCEAGATPRCVQNECVLCPIGTSGPPGCPDGG